MPTASRTVEFEDLADADLLGGAIYLGGNRGTAADDPLAKLLPVGNQGGFRHAGSPTKGTVRLSVLYTSGVEAEWPDNLDPETGIFTYFGDNRKPGRDLLKTTRGGNILLRNTFEAARGTREHRLSVPPFLLFEKAGIGRAVRFIGLMTPGANTSETVDDLTVVSHSTGGQEFKNYRARFTVLDTKVVRRDWLTSVLAGAATTNDGCPDAWREWVEEGNSPPSVHGGLPEGNPRSESTSASRDTVPATGAEADSTSDPAQFRDLSREPLDFERADLLDALPRLIVHRQGEHAAFYQYVVLLWAISRPLSGRLVEFSSVKDSLRRLLEPFAMGKNVPDPAVPWIALADSPWWEVELPDANVRDGVRPRDLVHRFDLRGGLSAAAHTLITQDDNFRMAAVAAIADIGVEHSALGDLLERLRLNSVRTQANPDTTTLPDNTDAVQQADSGETQSVARVTAITCETRVTENFEQYHPGYVAAERREAALQERYSKFLKDQGHQVCRQMIVVPGEAGALYTDVFDVTTGELIEVKADSGRATIRLALGQILDYARHISHSSKAVLVPARPTSDLIDLLGSCDVALVWEERIGIFRRLDASPQPQTDASAT